MRLALGSVNLVAERGDGCCLYFGNHKGAFFIGYHNLEKGWCSSTWFKPGFQYYRPALLTGRLFENRSTWHKGPILKIPANWVHVWQMRRRSYREAFREEPMRVGDAIPSDHSHS